MKLRHTQIQSILDGLYWRQVEGYEVTMSSSSCSRLVPSGVAYCCDIPKGKTMGDARHGPGGDFPSIPCLIVKNSFALWRVRIFTTGQERWSAREKDGININKAGGVTVAMYVQVRWKELLKGRRFMYELPVLSVLSFIPRVKDVPVLFLEDIYSVFKFELMCKLNLCISNLRNNLFCRLPCLQSPMY